VALLLETHVKPHDRFFVPNYQIHRTGRFPGLKGGTAIAVKEGVPPNHANLPSLVLIEATAICIPIGNSEVLLAAVYKLRVDPER
jgi:hypothetical protein